MTIVLWLCKAGATIAVIFVLVDIASAVRECSRQLKNVAMQILRRDAEEAVSREAIEEKIEKAIEEAHRVALDNGVAVTVPEPEPPQTPRNPSSAEPSAESASPELETEVIEE